MGGTNERRLRSKKEIKNEVPQQGAASTSLLNSQLDPTPAEAKELTQHKRAKEESPGYVLPKHHQSPQETPRSSPRPKRVMRKIPSIDQLFTEINQDFWAPVLPGPQATKVEEIDLTTSPSGSAGLTTLTTLRPETPPANHAFTTILPSATSPTPSGSIYSWYEQNILQLVEDDDIYMSSPDLQGEENAFQEVLPLPLLTAEDVSSVCSRMEVDPQGNQLSPREPVRSSTPYLPSGSSTPYLAPSDSDSSRSGTPTSPSYVSYVASGVITTPPYSPHSPSTTPPPLQEVLNFNLENAQHELGVMMEGFSPLLSPPASNFLNGRDPMLGMAATTLAAGSTTLRIPETTSTRTPTVSSSTDPEQSEVEHIEGLFDQLRTVSSQQRTCGQTLDIISAQLAEKRRFLEKEEEDQNISTTTKEVRGTREVAPSPPNSSTCWKPPSSSRFGSPPRRAPSPTRACTSSTTAPTSSPPRRAQVNLTYNRSFEETFTDIWSVLPNVFDPATETPIKYQRTPHGIRLDSEMIKLNDEFLCKWRQMANAMFAFVKNNCQEIHFLAEDPVKPENVRKAMRDILLIFMKRRNSKQMKEFMKRNQIPSLEESHKGDWFPSLVEITSHTSSWTNVLQHRGITTRPCLDKGTVLLYATIMSGPLSQKLIIPAISNGIAKQTNFMTSGAPSTIIPCLDYGDFQVTNDLAILRLQIYMLAGLVILSDEGEFFNESTNLHHQVYLGSGLCPPALERELYSHLERNDRNTVSQSMFNYIFAKRPAPSCWRNFYSSLVENNLSVVNQRNQRNREPSRRGRIFPPRSSRQYYTSFKDIQRPAPGRNWRKANVSTDHQHLQMFPWEEPLE